MIPISVVIPCFPRDTPKLKTCLDSIEKQTSLPLEVVIGHSEITQEDCNILKDRLQYTFEVVFSSNIKQCSAAENRNRACEVAKGTYISFIDADDQMFSQRLEIIWEIINKFKPICVIHGFSQNKNLFNTKYSKLELNKLTFGEDLYQLAKNTEYKHLYLNGTIHHAHSTVKSDVMKSIKYNESPEYYRINNGVGGEDSKFIRDILNKYPVNKTTMIFIDVPLSFYIPA